MSQQFLVEDITEEEVRFAVKHLNKGTSSGPTDVPPELITNLPDEYFEYLTLLCQNMWDNEQLPSQSHINDMIFLHKKGPTDNLKYYRTLATGCNVCKVFSKILTFRMQQVAEDNNLLGNIQTGFRKGRLGTENLFILETVIEKCKRHHEKLMIAMLDITKAMTEWIEISYGHKLRQFQFPDKLVRLLELLYSNTTCILKFQGLTSDPKRITLGLKQGCVMSPILFALYISDLGRLLEDSGMGINIRNITIPGLFFADDMLIWERESNFQKLLNIVRYYGQ